MAGNVIKSRRATEILAEFEKDFGRESDPIRVLLTVMMSSDKTWELRCECAKAVLPYLYPKLTTMQITGKDEGPIELASITAIMMNPALADAAETLALALASKRLPAPANQPRDDHGIPESPTTPGGNS